MYLCLCCTKHSLSSNLRLLFFVIVLSVDNLDSRVLETLLLVTKGFPDAVWKVLGAGSFSWQLMVQYCKLGHFCSVIGIIESLELGRTSEGHIVQLPCNEQTHLSYTRWPRA